MALLSVVSHVAFTQVQSCHTQCTHEAKAIVGGVVIGRNLPALIAVSLHLRGLELHYFAMDCMCIALHETALPCIVLP